MFHHFMTCRSCADISCVWRSSSGSATSSRSSEWLFTPCRTTPTWTTPSRWRSASKTVSTSSSSTASQSEYKASRCWHCTVKPLSNTRGQVRVKVFGRIKISLPLRPWHIEIETEKCAVNCGAECVHGTVSCLVELKSKQGRPRQFAG